jgi:beta-hydroxylase
MYLESAQFPFTTRLEQAWRTIRAEYEAVGPGTLMPWPEAFLYEGGWDVMGLWAFGAKLTNNCALCPRTAQLVQSIPGMTTAGFSVLEPGTHIRPHVGYSKEVLRCHLGLIVPNGCEMRVGADTRSWTEGQCLVFDDTVEHEVWHRGAAPRVVLLIDFMKSAHARGS